MTEKDKIFSFVEGLKSWARIKLYEQKVQDLTSAYATTECLFNLSRDSQDSRRHQSSSVGRNRNSRPNSPKAASENRSPVEIASLPNPTWGTLGKDMIVQTHRFIPLVTTYVIDHIGLKNAQIERPFMPFRPL